MANYSGTPDFEHGQRQRLGILVCNLGTPDAPTPRAVRRYLAEFLSDPRVIETPPLLWWPILHGVILNAASAPFRPCLRQDLAGRWLAAADPVAKLE